MQFLLPSVLLIGVVGGLLLTITALHRWADHTGRAWPWGISGAAVAAGSTVALVLLSSSTQEQSKQDAQELYDQALAAQAQLYEESGRYTGSVDELAQSDPELDSMLGDRLQLKLEGVPLSGGEVQITALAEAGAFKGWQVQGELDGGEEGSTEESDVNS